MDPSPDKEKPEKRPPSRGSAGENSEDRKFWGMDEEEEQPVPSGSAPDAPDPAGESEDPLDDDLDDDPDQSGEAPSAGSPVPAPETAPPAGRKISRSDFIWMGVLASFLLALLMAAFLMFKANIPTAEGPEDVDFPVKLKAVVIGDLDTFWRKPDREVDRVKLDAHLIPCATVTLKSGSGSGRLRLFFRNRENSVVGDPASLEFADGKFVTSGSNKITVNATDGFKTEGDYNAYVAEEVAFWHLDVLEQASGDSDTARPEPDLRVRILPNRR